MKEIDWDLFVGFGESIGYGAGEEYDGFEIDVRPDI